MTQKNARKAILFTALTYLISYLLVGIYIRRAGGWDMPGALIISTLYMFIPLIIVVLIQKVIYKEDVFGSLGVTFKANLWWLASWLIPVFIAFATLGVSFLLPGIRFDPEMSSYLANLSKTLPPEQFERVLAQIKAFPIHQFWFGLIQGLVAGISINAFAALGEEIGWRGFLQKQLQGIGFWRMSALIGVIWGFWHAPIILQGHNYPQHPVAGVFMMAAWTVLLTPILCFIRIKAKSVIAASIFHGTINAVYGLPVLVIAGGNDLTVGLTGVAGFITLIIINILLYLFMRRSNQNPGMI